MQQIARQVVAQSQEEGLDDEDAQWMAVGAIVREGRNQGVIGEVLSPEMNAAITALVKKEMKRGNDKQ